MNRRRARALFSCTFSLVWLRASWWVLMWQATHSRRMFDTSYANRSISCSVFALSTGTMWWQSNEILKNIIRRKIKDVRLLQLIDGIIDSEKGLPIGNYLSQSFANLYLAYFMHFCNETLQIKCTEYADDIVFFADNKTQLHTVFDTIKDYLATQLHLTIKSNYQIFPIAFNRYDRKGRALDYVGFCFYRNQLLMRKRIKKNFCRRVSLLRRHHVTGQRIKAAIAPWLGWAQNSQSRHLLTKILPEYENIL